MFSGDYIPTYNEDSRLIKVKYNGAYWYLNENGAFAVPVDKLPSEVFKLN